MIVPNSPQWYRARWARMSASRMLAYIRNPVAAAKALRHEIRNTPPMSEFERHAAMDARVRGARAWGKAHESTALKAYSLLHDTDVTEPGLLTHPELPYVVATPDGLVGPDGGVEAKCPEDPIEFERVRATGVIPEQYLLQVQGCMWVTQRLWWDIWYFDPRQPPARQAVRTRIHLHAPTIIQLGETCKRVWAMANSDVDPDSLLNPARSPVPRIF